MVADVYETNLELKTVDDAKSIVKESLEGAVNSPYCKIDPILVEAINILLAYPQKAHWIINHDESSEDAVVKCSNCGYTIITKFNDRDLKSFKDKYPFCKCCGFGMLKESDKMDWYMYNILGDGKCKFCENLRDTDEEKHTWLDNEKSQMRENTPKEKEETETDKTVWVDETKIAEFDIPNKNKMILPKIDDRVKVGDIPNMVDSKDCGAWLKNPVKKYCPPGDIDKKYAENAIDDTWDEEEGSWVEYEVICSECGKEPIDHILSEYCPHCGKLMVFEKVMSKKQFILNKIIPYLQFLGEKIGRYINEENTIIDTYKSACNIAGGDKHSPFTQSVLAMEEGNRERNIKSLEEVYESIYDQIRSIRDTIDIMNWSWIDE